MEDIHLKSIRRHYAFSQFIFSYFWSSNHTGYGLWSRDTRNAEEAGQNTDKYIANALALIPGENILDAGCGTGGSALFMANNYDVKCTGVNIAKNQLRIGRKKIKKTDSTNLVSLIEASYLELPFNENSFSKAYALESVYHTPDLQRFCDEMYRVLKPNGKLMVVDRFLVNKDIDLSSNESYQKFIAGQAVKRLPGIEEFQNCLNVAGFKNVQIEDKTSEMSRGIYEGTKLIKLTKPLNRFFAGIRVLPSEIYKHMESLIEIGELFKKGSVAYCSFLVTKPR